MSNIKKIINEEIMNTVANYPQFGQRLRSIDEIENMKNLLLKENYTSINLFEKINILTEEQMVNISTGLDWTVENIPNAVLIGGTAVVHYINGARDLTPDLDFMVDDINIVKTKLSEENIRYDDLNPGVSTPLGITVDIFNSDYLDIEIGNINLNKLVMQTPIIASIGGRQVHVINPELLVIMKMEVGRDKDFQDGIALLSSGKVDKNKYLQYLNVLKNSLHDYESLFNYKDFIQ